jgi:hypothetical protein
METQKKSVMSVVQSRAPETLEYLEAFKALGAEPSLAEIVIDGTVVRSTSPFKTRAEMRLPVLR